MSKFFEGVLGLGVLILMGGIIAAPLAGSERSFEIAPILSLIGKLGGWVDDAAEVASTPEENPDSFLDVASDSVERVGDAIEDADLPIASDPRLSICPEGSIAKEDEIPLDVALRVYQNKPVLLDILDAQAMIGEPNCLINQGSRVQWRYIAPGNRIIDVVQEQESDVELKFTNF